MGKQEGPPDTAATRAARTSKAKGGWGVVVSPPREPATQEALAWPVNQDLSRLLPFHSAATPTVRGRQGRQFDQRRRLVAQNAFRLHTSVSPRRRGGSARNTRSGTLREHSLRMTAASTGFTVAKGAAKCLRPKGRDSACAQEQGSVD